MIHLDLDCSVCSFNSSQVARVLFSRRFHSRPLWILVGNADSFYGGKVQHAHLVMWRNQWTGSHIVLHILRKTGKNELVRRRTTHIRLRLHSYRLPSSRALVMRKDLRFCWPHTNHT